MHGEKKKKKKLDLVFLTVEIIYESLGTNVCKGPRQISLLTLIEFKRINQLLFPLEITRKPFLGWMILGGIEGN